MSLLTLLAAESRYLQMSESKNKGFTLLEVMISLAIVGGLLVTLIYTLNYHLGIAERQFTVTNIVNLACDKMNEMEKNPQSRQGRFPAPYGELFYETKISKTTLTDLSEITVSVDGGKEKIVLSEFVWMPQAGL
jgi:general secretion pathway protein I